MESKISIVIPVYFGENLLWDCYNEIKEKVLDELNDYEVVMVDDGSADASWEVMQAIAAKDNRVKLVKLSRNFGADVATYVGFCHATGDCAALLPQDLQTPPEVVLSMYESWKRGNKVVMLTRSGRKDPKLSSSLFYWFAKRYVNPNIPQSGIDIGLLDKRAIETLKLMDENDSAVTLQILWMGFKSEMLKCPREERISGKSGYNFSKRLKLGIDSVIGFSYFPIKFISTVSIIFFTAGILWAIWLVLDRWLNGSPIVAGWTTLMIVILFSSGLIMLSLSVLGEYIWRTLDAARRRPTYILDEVIEAGELASHDKEAT
ncbi:MAG: glycosyltransferase family 2 protein [Lachnospiraceae bacterium]|nr:glycosyltransferase family 2 protein [Lachnospiraceae bacterium]